MMSERGLSSARKVVVLLICALLSSCSISQEVTRLQSYPQTVCIAEHAAVKNGTLEAVQEAFRGKGIATRVIPGIYTLSHNVWNSTVQTQDVAQCDAVVYYVANWSWDLALYMYFANIWMTPPDNSRIIAQVTYDASRGGARPDKFVNGREKIIELVNQILGER